ncbi:MAG: hypothetical protein GEU83_03280 [Pseudonocardiaceae bacterium]|nr:hypothetical protein [Pseudonocardiaceae bacterium]
MIQSLLPTVVVAAAVLAGCGGAPAPADVPGADPLQWADAYCSGIGATVTAALQLGDPRARVDAAAQQEALAGYLDTAQTGYRDALQRLQWLGPPAVMAGEWRQGTATEYYRGSLQAVQDQAARLSRLDPAAPDFSQRFNEIEQSGFEPGPLQRELDALRTDPELAAALQRAPACTEIDQQLGGAGAPEGGATDGDGAGG